MVWLWTVWLISILIILWSNHFYLKVCIRPKKRRMLWRNSKKKNPDYNTSHGWYTMVEGFCLFFEKMDKRLIYWRKYRHKKWAYKKKKNENKHKSERLNIVTRGEASLKNTTIAKTKDKRQLRRRSQPSGIQGLLRLASGVDHS